MGAWASSDHPTIQHVQAISDAGGAQVLVSCHSYLSIKECETEFIFSWFLKKMYWIILSPVHMRWFTHGMQIIHICIICTGVYFWACERNCIYVKVNLHMCKYTPPCKYTPAQTRCIFAFTYMCFIHICIFGHVNAQQIYTRMQIKIWNIFCV